MRIDRVFVEGLFGYFNHDLPLKPNEPIAIVHGPNGYGKTWILRILNGLFSKPIRTLGRMPFRQVTAWFDDSSSLTVRRDASRQQPVAPLLITFNNASGSRTFNLPPLDAENLGIPLSSIDDFVEGLVRTGPTEWHSSITGEVLDLDDVLTRYGDQLPISAGDEASREPASPDWLEHIRTSIPVRLIDTERLTQHSDVPFRRPGSRLHSQQRLKSARTVRKFSRDLGERVGRTLTEYGALSQSLDRTFPARLVSAPRPSPTQGSSEELRTELDQVEARRSQLVKAGLLAAERDVGWGVPFTVPVDESKRAVLAVYAEDAKKKLGVFDQLYHRVEMLTRIANQRLLYKRLVVSDKGLDVVGPDESKLDLEMLSSGEQHEVVLLYELLFLVNENSLILIDEPELSLHADWQVKFLDDLAGIAALGNFRVLLATHSPQIIADRWDLTIELKGPEGR